MSAVSWSLVLISLVIFSVGFVISYEMPDLKIIVWILIIIGFIFMIIGLSLSYKDMNIKKCNNCKRSITPNAKVCTYCGNKL